VTHTNVSPPPFSLGLDLAAITHRSFRIRGSRKMKDGHGSREHPHPQRRIKLFSQRSPLSMNT